MPALIDIAEPELLERYRELWRAAAALSSAAPMRRRLRMTL